MTVQTSVCVTAELFVGMVRNLFQGLFFANARS